MDTNETNEKGFVSPVVIAVIGIVLAGIAVAAIRYKFTGPEDYWQCNEGRWVKHGIPLKPKPTGICPSAQDVNAVKRPDNVVEDFYDGYVPMAQVAGASPTAALMDSVFLSAAFKDKIKDITEAPAEDIFYCSTNKPSKVAAAAPSLSPEDKATVRVEETFGDGTAKNIGVTLIWEGDAWRIDDVSCEAPAVGAASEPEKSEGAAAPAGE